MSDAEVAGPVGREGPGPIAYEPDQEVRIGLVMYGGVSLAVYINGVAQELLALVRSTAPAVDPVSGEPAVDTTGANRLELEALTPVERVYRELGQILDQPAADVATASVRNRFVVDIIAGSSAGGINGVYLAKALANQQDIGALKKLWIEEAGVGNILNDSVARSGHLGSLPKDEPTESLFSGDIMYLQLLKALEAMDTTQESVDRAAAAKAVVPPGSGAPASPFVQDLDLWITATDLAGVALPLRLDGRTINETQHRHTFHFVFGEAQVETGRLNDFDRTRNPILAFAARATSSFPFAFAPARLVDIARVKGADGTWLDPARATWAKWFPNHRRLLGAGYQEVAFGDGGDIDNKPFSWVTDTLAARTSSSPVDRRVFYVEPDPGDPPPTAAAAPKPDVVGSTISAISLGRVENIREDVDRLDRRTSSARKIRTAVEAVDRLAQQGVSGEAESTTTADWLAEDRNDMWRRGLPYAAYYELRVEALIAEFSRSLAEVPWHAADSAASLARRCLVERWVDESYADPYEATDGGKPTTKHFLRDFDIAFRIRRLGFVAERADRLARRADQLAEEGKITDAPRFRAELRRVKGQLAEAEEGLRRCVPSLRSAREVLPDGQLSGLATFPLSDEEEAALLAGDVDAVWAERGDEFAIWCRGVAAYLAGSPQPPPAGSPAPPEPAFKRASRLTAAALELTGPLPVDEAAARTMVGSYFKRYADFDQVTFSAQTVAGITGEIDPVRVHRISPDDADRLSREFEQVRGVPIRKVAGSSLGHFGGFLDAGWRANDIMWGRLDAAELVVQYLLGNDDGRGAGLVERLQDAILEEEWFAEGRPGATWARSVPGESPAEGRARRRQLFLERYQVPVLPPTKDLLALGGRSLDVTNELTANLAVLPAAPGMHKVVGLVGWVLSALGATWFPDRLRSAFFRTFALVVMAFGLVLAVAATPIGWHSGTSTGGTLLLAGTILLVLALATRLVWSHIGNWKVWLGVVAAVILLPLLVYGGVQLWAEVLSTRWPFD